MHNCSSTQQKQQRRHLAVHEHSICIREQVHVDRHKGEALHDLLGHVAQSLFALLVTRHMACNLV